MRIKALPMAELPIVRLGHPAAKAQPDAASDLQPPRGVGGLRGQGRAGEQRFGPVEDAQGLLPLAAHQNEGIRRDAVVARQHVEQFGDNDARRQRAVILRRLAIYGF